jgi:Na+-transporting methylmalonyl-CoA/oxaloacetate decarboxylase gamma subunit
MTAIRKEIRIFGTSHQQGAALVIAVIILLILTVVGIYAVTTSTIETKITGFEREFKEAFFTADSGEPIGIEVTKAIIHYVPTTISDLPAPWNDSGVIDADLFTGSDPEIFTDDRDTADDPDNGPDIDSQGAGNNLGFPSRVRLRVDIDRLASYQMSGGATEFGSGYEGIGRGGGGHVAILYEIDSIGRYTSNAKSAIEAGYRHVVSMPGGE